MPRIGGDLWQWLSDGAHFYVCGAVRMGQDVERAMVDIVVEHGRKSASEAIAFVTDLKKRGRYQADVY
jgi:sulfite reductase (NADPH) flavoprotein alpha-component